MKPNQPPGPPMDLAAQGYWSPDGGLPTLIVTSRHSITST
jgi:hypothetical protein